MKIGIIVALVIIVIAVLIYFYNKNKNAEAARLAALNTKPMSLREKLKAGGLKTGEVTIDKKQASAIANLESIPTV